MKAVQNFMLRYHDLLIATAKDDEKNRASLIKVADICKNISQRPPQIFHNESIASSYSPCRFDKILYPYYIKDIENNILTKDEALEIIECLWLKFNEIVYLRNQHSAKYFAGFPIGFNIAVGGVDEQGNDFSNDLSE